ncbi:MAG TPA: glycosyltransferase [Myxococcota bacterium]|jgi:hypothetical protein|nr:glycosyltransferase [Myxococcota bacterium]
MDGLKVLVTNLKLTSRSGTELYARDLGLALLRRGHRPVVYAPMAEGSVVDELRRATVPVVERLGQVGFAPDVIHGHHAHQTMAALLHFERAPGIFLCHDARAWHDEPPHHPRIRRYVAVDRACRDRLVAESGVAEARVDVLHNFVDLARFAPRGALPARPRRALVFSNHAQPGGFLDAVAEACRRCGVELDVVGASVGRSVEKPEELLGAYDLVFAKAKAAMEGLAVGAAVVLCASLGLGGLVTTERFELLRANNFGRRTLRDPVTPDSVEAAIRAYDPADAAEVSRRFRGCGGLETTVDALVALYEEVIHEHASVPPPEPEAERRAVAAYMERLASTEAIVDSANYKTQNDELRRRLAALEGLPVKRPLWRR